MDRQRKKGRHSGQEAQQEQRLAGRRIREPRLAAGRGMCLGALRAQWDYNPDWFDRRHGGKNEMSVLVTSSPLVSDGKMEAARCTVSLVTRSCPESTAPWPPSCCLFEAARPLALPVLTVGITFQRPVSLNSPSCLLQKSPRPARRPVPQLRLPKPAALAALYSYLRSRKIKILEILSKGDRGENQRISREEFIVALKTVSASRAPSGLA